VPRHGPVSLVMSQVRPGPGRPANQLGGGTRGRIGRPGRRGARGPGSASVPITPLSPVVADGRPGKIRFRPGKRGNTPGPGTWSGEHAPLVSTPQRGLLIPGGAPRISVPASGLGPPRSSAAGSGLLSGGAAVARDFYPEQLARPVFTRGDRCFQLREPRRRSTWCRSPPS